MHDGIGIQKVSKSATFYAISNFFFPILNPFCHNNRMPPDRDKKFILCYERIGSSRKNADFSTPRMIGDVLANNYPESVSKILVIFFFFFFETKLRKIFPDFLFFADLTPKCAVPHALQDCEAIHRSRNRI